MTFDYEKLDAEIMQMAFREWNCPTIADIPPLQPEDADDSILFTNNFLAKGQSMALVGSSGTGKSSLNMQECYHWACGRTFLASPRRPLKIAIIQTEDSLRDVQEQIAGMRRGLAEQGWEQEDIAEAERNISMPNDFIGLQGDAFIAQLREFQHDLHFDLISINPLQGVFGGDLSDQEAASHFCRAGLDPIMKDPQTGCCMQIVMHTPKQKSGNKEGRASVDDYAEYMMAGSQEWTAWCRAIFTFLKHGTANGYFDLTCPKRGHRLDWAKPKRTFAFSDGYIFWREVLDEQELANIDAKKNSESSESPEASADEVEKCKTAILDYLRHNPAVKRSDLSRIPKLPFKRHTLRVATREILINPSAYRLTVRLVGFGKHRAEYIGFADGFKIVDKQAKQQLEIDNLNEQAQQAQQAQQITQAQQSNIISNNYSIYDDPEFPL